ncbi:AAA family ATPase [Acidimicrobiaceae bacterium USS-CC1]|uniref:AAA family ATPase n=1 Tax=Acidiferrimicrobium australe TaxID=2664430 RepID=A0ABW9QT52_9ACTN|nr:AAA family ATPase [Acidiferrimicrobium australe]
MIAGPSAPGVVETHISTVFLVGERAFKLKKGLATAFLDWSTPAKRRQACRDEVALNRRLSPDVYLGVLDVVDERGRLQDALVVMRRMPSERSLEALVRAGEPVEDAVRALARLLADFHGGARRDATSAAAARPDAVARLWSGNLEELRSLHAGPGIGVELDAIEHLAHSYQTGRAGLFARRAAQGRSCDGHGDLQAADVFLLDDGPRVLDCLEFDPVLRAGDVLADVAFLAMDLERLGAAGVAAALLRAYRSLTGEDWPASLADFWVAYRALVRAKVALLRAPWDPGAPGQAEELLGLCRRHLEAATVRLVLVGGTPGTGKTTVASGLADRTGWVHLATDEVRADLPPSAAPAEVRGAGYGVGRYRAELVSATYRLLLERAESCLAAGESVVLDATWTSAGHRAAAAALADRLGAHRVDIRCEIGMEEALRRVRRRAAGGGRSELTPEIVRAIAERQDPWPGALPLDTARPVAEVVEAAVAAATAPPPPGRHEGTFGPSSPVPPRPAWS